MKSQLITILRDKNTPLDVYRRAADHLGTIMAIESASLLPKSKIVVETPLAKSEGEIINKNCLLIPILRSGLVLLHPFLQYYPNASIGFIGARRNEQTAIPELYYSKIPPFDANTSILLLDPMIATGGSSIMAVNMLKKLGAKEKQIALISLFGAPEGINRFKKECPDCGLLVAQVDQKLTPKKWIYPGLGDFGDRYFGTL